jgi:hypothetical protein
MEQKQIVVFLHERKLGAGHGRDERRIRVGCDDSRYDLPALKWTQSSFFQPHMMAHDRYFYDPVAHRYTVDRYLDDLRKRYGGIDAVLVTFRVGQPSGYVLQVQAVTSGSVNR